MSQSKILITLEPYPPSLQRLLRDDRLSLRVVKEPWTGEHGERAGDWPLEWLSDANILFCGGVAPTNFQAMQALRWVQLGSAGYERFVGLGLPEKGISASNSLGVFDVPIAEWNLAMMVNLARDLRGMIRHQEQGQWDRHARHQSEIRGMTVGLWGYGGIGRETARLAKAMGMKVHVFTRSGVKPRVDTYAVAGTGDPEGTLPDRVFTMESKREFLEGLDFLILAMPLTPQSVGSVKAEDLRCLPRHACLLNPARGPLIPEADLLEALQKGWIGGAALDTHYHYPMPPDHPLWRMPQVIMTPHISGSGQSPHYLERAWDIFEQNLDRFLNGQPLLNELSPAQLRGE